ncbi:MBL fold metallo-hydrolase [Marivirga sp. S37H4]|uniref:MBL fold metallo-hydrolase n=1 Tax=Marivirga aurantiaca TaxID=2802615 RepID=A0A934WXS9_9BACT|nr:MBL fold metallo-hydrolase [Marivirga aurantiaca]MBK6264847.1 MBL fold metallo-hydrolase [Marivirga aurantiaca]
MDVRIKFLGGAQSVTGSKFLLEIDEFRLLIDCGLFQGLKKLRLRNWEDLPIPAESIDAIVLTHAHLDHSGYVPRIVKQGFKGKIHCTEATADLLEILWIDSAKLQEEEAEFIKKKGYSKHENPLALYNQKDVQISLPLLKTHPFETLITLTENIQLKFYPAGHILGASIVELKVKGDTQEKNLLISGDIGRENDPVLFPPTVVKSADIVLMESTYGDRINNNEDIKETLKDHILKNIDSGVIMIPAFTVGRTQNLLLYLHDLMRTGDIPETPVYIDSPMAISVTSLYEKYDALHRLEDKAVFNDRNFHYVKDQMQSNSLKALKNKAIIISASGMLTGGRILNHLFQRLSNKNDTLLFSGYQAIGTRGRDILEGKEKIRIYGEEISVHCQYDEIEGLSAHADQTELIEWYQKIVEKPKYTFIVHGEIRAAEALKSKLENAGAKNVFIPDYLESFELFSGI